MKKSDGFTLVELLLAMAFFSFILLFVTTGFVMVNRAYNKGLTVKLIQDEGRRVTEDLTRKIRVASSEGIITTSNCLEISGTRYYWSVPIDSSPGSPMRLYEEDGRTCTDSINVSNPGGVSMLNDRVGVQFMEVAPVAGSNSIYTLKVVLSTSDATLISGDLTENANCGAGQGSQYCDVILFDTVVSVR